ncbi:alpha/beta fold hydrolase [Sulfitobacter sp.]|uniref:alpha/beta fold hydrolase n=1 Tax=Sulfitobacter sp. TaxID=1903071 RepID=UPI003299B5F6
MSNQSGSTPPAPPSSTQELIESIYRIALEPQTYDSFMGHWDEFILEQVSKLTALQADSTARDDTVNETEISKHFAIAMQLLEQAGRPDLRTQNISPHKRLPQLVFNSSGALVWHNNAAADAFDVRLGATLDCFDIPPPQQAEIQALFKGKTASSVVIARLPTLKKGKPLPMAFKLTNASAHERLFLASEVRQTWPEQMGRLLAGGFGLSPSEVQICAQLVAGHTAVDIARDRSTALGTVRTQIKKILQKTDTTGQVDLVNLLHATIQIAQQHEIKSPPSAKIPDRVHNIALPDRNMPVETFGDPLGMPVIFFHGMLDGNGISQRLRNLLDENSFHLICPVRPSFGTAPPDETGPVATAPARLARDIKTLMERMGIKQALFLGHMAGSVYAMHAAASLGKRVCGILSVAGGAPLVSTSQFATMSPRQRVVGLTARYTPRLLPFIIRAGINQLDNAGERQFMQSLYQTSPIDMRVANDPETTQILYGGYHFTIAQGHRAFEIDSYHVVRDWTSIAMQSNQPVELLHGMHDPVVSYSSIQAYHRQLGDRARLTGLPDSGQLILYQNPEEVIAALIRLRNA